MKKTILLTALGFILCVPPISAQCDSTKCEKGKRGNNREARMEQVIKELELTETQAAEFRAINQKYGEQLKSERAEMQKQNQAHREKAKAINESRKEEIKNILSDQQYDKLKKMQRKNHSAHKGQKGKKPHYKHRHHEKS